MIRAEARTGCPVHGTTGAVLGLARKGVDDEEACHFPGPYLGCSTLPTRVLAHGPEARTGKVGVLRWRREVAGTRP